MRRLQWCAINVFLPTLGEAGGMSEAVGMGEVVTMATSRRWGGGTMAVIMAIMELIVVGMLLEGGLPH